MLVVPPMTDTMSPETRIGAMAASACAAGALLARLAPADKASGLRSAATAIRAAEATILAANAQDMAAGKAAGLSAAMLDRLMLDAARVAAMAAGVEAVAALDDPIGAVIDTRTAPSGILLSRIRVPIGVIGIVYESRPNVTADAGALCLKAGNAVILRGGSESFHSSSAIHACLVEGLRVAGLPEAAIQLVPTRDRAAVQAMLQAVEHIDVIVPRGGKGLVGLVQREARVPVFAHLEGIVHIYLDKAADPQKALDVVINAKTRRTGICGAAECLLIHRDVVDTIGQGIVRALLDLGVEVRGDETVQKIEGVVPATDEDWGKEYLDSILAARVVEDLDEALDYIRTHHSAHTDAILTEDDAAAARFFNELDSAILIRNASTQFADGGEFGMGAEIGIATGKMHARGPIGAEQLTSFKYLVEGDGAVRK